MAINFFSIIQQTQSLKNKIQTFAFNNLLRSLANSICDFNVVDRNWSMRSDVALNYVSCYCNMVQVWKIKGMLEEFPRLCIHSMLMIPMVYTATVVLQIDKKNRYMQLSSNLHFLNSIFYSF